MDDVALIGSAPAPSVPPGAGGAGEPPVDAFALGWAAALPIGAALAAGIAWLVPPLTRKLAVTPSPAQLPLAETAPHTWPVPDEQALYLVCLAVPAIVAWGAAVAATRTRRTLRSPGWLTIGVQVAIAAAIVATWAFQYLRVHRYVEPVRWGLGLAVTVAGALLARRVAPAFAGRRWPVPAAVVAAAAYAGARCSGAILDDVAILKAPHTVSFHLPFTLDEFAAVLAGRTAWVDYFPQYVTLLPYALAPVFRAIGLDVLTFTSAMALLSFAGLMLQYDVFRRVTGSPGAALALHVPFVALAFYPIEMSPGVAPATAFSYFALAPLRYLGPWIVGWLVAWHLSRPTTARLLVLFAGAGLATVNNLDFGLPALGGALLAALLAGPRTLVPRAAQVARVIGAALAGLALGVAVLVVVSWIRTGSTPDFGRVLMFQGAFAVTGFNMLPLPPWGLHWVVYGTFVVGLVTALFQIGASERAAPPPGERSTGMPFAGALLFASTFGFGALALYVGRSHWAVLIGAFPAWAAVIAMLCWATLGPCLRGEHRWLTPVRAVPVALAVALYALCVGEVVPRPRPRLDPTAGPPASPGAERAWYLVNAPRLARALRAATPPGEPVMIAIPGGNLIALLGGVRNVYPFAEAESCIVHAQAWLVVDTISAQRVSAYVGPAQSEVHRLLEADPPTWGFRFLNAPPPKVAPGWPD